MFRHVLPNLPEEELRPLLPSHTDALFTLIDTNRAYLRRWLPCMADLHTRDDVAALIAESHARNDPEDGYVLGVWYRGTLVGMVGFNAIDPINRAAEVGYWLGKPYQGRGLMTNAVRALVNDAFATMHLHRVIILCAVGNTRSAAVARRLGFHQEGVIREAEWLEDRYVDDEVYAMLAPEWRATPTPTAALLHA